MALGFLKEMASFAFGAAIKGASDGYQDGVRLKMLPNLGLLLGQDEKIAKAMKAYAEHQKEEMMQKPKEGPTE